MTDRIRILGVGAVSPLGWSSTNLPTLINGATNSEILAEPTELERPGWDKALSVKTVPTAPQTQAFRKNPRYRRASSISKYAAASMIEALNDAGADELEKSQSQGLEIGVIFTVMSGCVNYSRRFFTEVLSDPSTASPLLFPETVFNAPSSHLSTYLKTSAPNYTLVGDSSVWGMGLAMGAQWLLEEKVDRVLVVAAEEIDWLTSDAFHLFSKNCQVSEGAAAVYLSKEKGSPTSPDCIELLGITNPVPHTSHVSRNRAMQMVKNELASEEAFSFSEKCVLVDSVQGVPSWDRAELDAWADWTGPRISPKLYLGEGLAASAGWQTVVGIQTVREGKADQAIISCPGLNHQAIGILLGKSNV